MRPRFGAELGLGPSEELVERARRLEKEAFDILFYYDHILYWNLNADSIYEAWMTLAAVACHTRTIRLSPFVTDPLRRHPSVTAQATLTLDQISKGRAVLCIGAGSPINLEPFGISWQRPVTKLKEAAIVILQLWTATRNEPSNFKGEFFRLDDAFLQLESVQKPHPPLLMSGFGPVARRIAGSIADGFVTSNESPEMLKRHLIDVEAGLKEAGRDLGKFDVVLHTPIAISDKVEEARNAVLKSVRLDVSSQPFQRRELGIVGDTPELKMLGEYRQEGMKGASVNALLGAANAASNQISENVVDEIAVYGTSDDCLDRIEKYVKAGVKTFSFQFCGPDSSLTQHTMSTKIIPYLRQAYRD